MANRTSSRLLLTAFGVSLLAGAGQLGLAFGFGIVRLTGAFTGTTVNQWPAQLVWVGWFAAHAAVIGAVYTARLARRDGQLTGTARQLTVVGSAALGAMVVAPLCMQPARTAELISTDPVWAVAICASLGAMLGAAAALAVLLRPPVAWNIAAVAGALWLVALLSVAPSLAAAGPLTPVRLGVLEPAWLSPDAAQRLALLVLPLVSLLAGAATGALARWRGYPPLISAPGGIAGPVLVAFAYLAAGPGDPVDRYQLAPYYGALLAFAAGALGWAAAALLPWPPGGRPAEEAAIEPAAILQPLPAAPALPAPAGQAGPPDGEDSAPPHWNWPDAGRPETDDQAPAATPDTNDPTADGDSPTADGDSPTADVPAPVGDGSDIPPAASPVPPVTGPAVTPTHKAPAPRRTRKPRVPATSASPADRSAEASDANRAASESTTTPPAELDPATAAREVSAAFVSAPVVSTDPAATARDLSAAFTKPSAVARPEDVQRGGDRDTGRRGLFRRGRSRSADAGAAVEREEPLPVQDEEYVDWVAGLGRPVAEDGAETREPRRSLRSIGRHPHE